MPTENRTAEEILGKNTGMTFDDDSYLIQTHLEYVIKAMKEFAEQRDRQIIEEFEKQYNIYLEVNTTKAGDAYLAGLQRAIEIIKNLKA